MTDTANNFEILLLGDVFRHIIVKPSPKGKEKKAEEMEGQEPLTSPFKVTRPCS